CSVWLYFGLMNNPTGPATSLVQFLPIDFMTSVSIGPIVFILMNLVPPLCYFFDYFRAKKGEGENRG
ncbi:MAG: hypothetical protein HUJ60_03305, partial [Bacilli bacterium]|nr:hypothetical protein [Bacilli bacterium]